MTAFTGFPSTRGASVPVPDLFFSAVLPQIEDPLELKVILKLFSVLYHKGGAPRCVSDREMLQDTSLRQLLRRKGDPRTFAERLQAALTAATQRGVLLRVRVRIENGVVSWYFFHTDRNRRYVEKLLRGEITPLRLLELEGIDPQDTKLAIELERPTIFTLYEQNIGLLVPLVAEQLIDAAEHYPHDWIADAFREAADQNKRSWSYIRAILQRWETDGRGQKKNG